MSNKEKLLQFAFAQARAGSVAPEALLVRVRKENRKLPEPATEEAIKRVVDDAMRHADLSQQYMDSREFAALRHVTEQAIRKERAYGRGPAFYRIGGRVLYLRSEVEEWLQSKREAR